MVLIKQEHYNRIGESKDHPGPVHQGACVALDVLLDARTTLQREKKSEYLLNCPSHDGDVNTTVLEI